MSPRTIANPSPCDVATRSTARFPIPVVTPKASAARNPTTSIREERRMLVPSCHHARSLVLS